MSRFGRVRMAHRLFGTFVLGVRRFVGLMVTQANKRLCHVALALLSQALWNSYSTGQARSHQARSRAEGIRAILGRGARRAQTNPQNSDRGIETRT